ncbi:hypothetical protein ISU10_11245 [Nocardioides agariphilus]|uniref:Uncharacterized protein n=1 Tax=Nocardioides agariphilus TaxID=433664 RepID=A0A930YIM5_9ACTN|nr:hypothetical protein [Nocardioides agariphilus]MBF4768342.1 hypothetical protein [Nocardioides agariphilus]
MSEQLEDSGVKVDLTLDGGGLSFKRAVPEAVALKIMALAMGASVNLGQTPSTARRPTPEPETDLDSAEDKDTNTFTPLDESVGEFVHRHGATRNVEKIAAIAMYLTTGGQERFTSEQLKEQFPKAGEKVPGNYPRDFRWAVQSKWIAEDHQRAKHFYITNSGKNAVNSKFSKDVRKASNLKTGKKRSSSASKSADSAE